MFCVCVWSRDCDRIPQVKLITFRSLCLSLSVERQICLSELFETDAVQMFRVQERSKLVGELRGHQIQRQIGRVHLVLVRVLAVLVGVAIVVAVAAVVVAVIVAGDQLLAGGQLDELVVAAVRTARGGAAAAVELGAHQKLLVLLLRCAEMEESEKCVKHGSSGV